MKKLSRTRENLSFDIDRNREPLLYIESGETVVFETERADSRYLDDDPNFEHKDKVAALRVNPVTGPIFVKHAKPGDFLRIDILDVSVGDGKAFTAFQPDDGIFSDWRLKNMPPPETRFFEPDREYIRFEANNGRVLHTPCRPMIGTMAVAHEYKTIPTLRNEKSVLGNVDCPMLKKGSSVLLPVNVPGGLLSIGDIHAGQSAGELAGTAIECRGEAVVRVAILKRADVEYFDWPQVDDETHITSIAFAENSLLEAIRLSSYDLMQRLMHDTGITFSEAAIFAGQAFEIDICQCAKGFATVCTKLRRDYFRQKGIKV